MNVKLNIGDFVIIKSGSSSLVDSFLEPMLGKAGIIIKNREDEPWWNDKLYAVIVQGFPNSLYWFTINELEIPDGKDGSNENKLCNTR